MALTNDYPLPAFYFKLRFWPQEDEDAAFQDVSGIGAQMETEAYREGGENRFQYQLPKGVTHNKLVLKRCIAASTSLLVQWCKLVLEGGSDTIIGFTAKIQTKTISVMLLNAEGQPACVWLFADAYPIGWTVESFNATKNEVAIESIELAYTYSQRLL